jgi:hypothetical protein
VHQRVCKYVFRQKRPVFEAHLHRIKDTPAESITFTSKAVPPCAHCGKRFPLTSDAKVHALTCHKRSPLGHAEDPGGARSAHDGRVLSPARAHGIGTVSTSPRSTTAKRAKSASASDSFARSSARRSGSASRARAAPVAPRSVPSAASANAVEDSLRLLKGRVLFASPQPNASYGSSATGRRGGSAQGYQQESAPGSSSSSSASSVLDSDGLIAARVLNYDDATNSIHLVASTPRRHTAKLVLSPTTASPANLSYDLTAPRARNTGVALAAYMTTVQPPKMPLPAVAEEASLTETVNSPDVSCIAPVEQDTQLPGISNADWANPAVARNTLGSFVASPGYSKANILRNIVISPERDDEPCASASGNPAEAGSQRDARKLEFGPQDADEDDEPSVEQITSMAPVACASCGSTVLGATALCEHLVVCDKWRSERLTHYGREGNASFASLTRNAAIARAPAPSEANADAVKKNLLSALSPLAMDPVAPSASHGPSATPDPYEHHTDVLHSQSRIPVFRNSTLAKRPAVSPERGIAATQAAKDPSPVRQTPHTAPATYSASRSSIPDHSRKANHIHSPSDPANGSPSDGVSVKIKDQLRLLKARNQPAPDSASGPKRSRSIPRKTGGMAATISPGEDPLPAHRAPLTLHTTNSVSMTSATTATASACIMCPFCTRLQARETLWLHLGSCEGAAAADSAEPAPLTGVSLLPGRSMDITALSPMKGHLASNISQLVSPDAHIRAERIAASVNRAKAVARALFTSPVR